MSNLDNLSTEELRVLAGYDDPTPHIDKGLKSAHEAGKNAHKKGSAGKYIAMIPRSLAAIPGYTSDLANLPLNLIGRGGHALVKKYAPNFPDFDEHPGHGEQTKQAIDKVSKDYAKPNSKGERFYETILEAGIPGGAAIGKTAAKTAAKTLATRIPQVGGAGIGEYLDNPYLGFGATLAGKGVAATPNAIRNLNQKAKLSRLKTGPNASEVKKKVLEKLSKESGGHDYSSVSNERAGNLATKSAQRYLDKSKDVFDRVFKRSKSHLEPHVSGRNNPNRLVNTEKVLDFGIEKMASLAETPSLQKEWLDSAAGQKWLQILKINQKSGGVPIRGAEQIRRNIGNKTSKVGATGNEEQGELRHISGLLKEQIGKKYEEAGKHAHRNWVRSHKHYTNHKEQKVPIINEILALKNKPGKAFKHSVEELGSDATNLKHISQYSKGVDKELYHRGVVFELGKLDDKFDLATFHKNFSKLPAANKRLILDSLPREDRAKLWKARRQLKTMNALEKKKGTADIINESTPHGVFKTIGKTLWNPIKKVRANNYTSQKQINHVVKALKDKAGTPTKAPLTMWDRSDKIHSAIGSLRKQPDLIKQINQNHDIDRLSTEELRELAGYDRK